MSFYNLTISSIIEETADAKTLVFTIPSDLTTIFAAFKPGQYLTIKADINGEEVRRSYSICTLPGQSTIGVTVKKLNGGKMSTHLNDKIKIGDVLDVMSPEGKFVVKPQHDISRDHYFFAAGSGITPVMSMISTLLEEEPRSTCYLLYGNRDEQSIIFKEALDNLVIKYQDQCYVNYVLSQPAKRKSEGLLGLLGSKKSDWKGDKGRIDGAKCMQFMYDNPGRHDDRHYYICGPGDFINTVEAYLSTQDIDKKKIHKEYFSTTEEVSLNTMSIGSGVMVRLKGEDIVVEVPKDKTILEALVNLKKDPPYSCTSGACSTCIAKVISGTVVMDSCYALDDDEVAAGYILTCQAHPSSNGVSITYDLD
jgi:ring-1,2-phenylacetyl-CoA epoxidase subunit PaaE